MRMTMPQALAALVITTVGALGADNSLGTWKLNTEKSKFTPGPSPVKSLTVAREASAGGVKVTITGERADGTPINGGYSAKYDGTDVQVTGNTPYDTIAVKQINSNTLTDERKKSGGAYRANGRRVILKDGKMTWMTGSGSDGD